MKSTERVPEPSPMKLLPHQTALVETVFNPATKHVILLKSYVGLGKSTALVAVCVWLLQNRPASRALILCPAPMGMQFVQKLRDANVPSLLVDRFRFREMLDATIEGEFWPSGLTTIMSFDFAKQDDVKESLARTHWDLVVVDESHQIKGMRAEALRQIGASADRVILASATPLDFELSDVFPGEEPTVVEWRSESVFGHDGKQLNALPRPVLKEISFNLSPAELSLRETVGSLTQIFESGTPKEGWIAKILLSSLESSPVALERALRGFLDRTALGNLQEPVESLDDEMLVEEEPIGKLDLPTRENACRIAMRAIQEIETIAADSKLTAVAALLTRLDEMKTPSQRICVLTEYRATLFYLTSDIEGRGTKCTILHGGMRAEQGAQSLEFSSKAGGILVATTAVIRAGIDLPEVTDLVLYDIPSSRVALQQVLGRFNRFGRLSKLRVHVIAPSNTDSSLTSEDAYIHTSERRRHP